MADFWRSSYEFCRSSNSFRHQIHHCLRPCPLHRHRSPARRRRSPQDRRLLARLQFPQPRDDLPARQSPAAGTPPARAHQEPPARPLGIEPRPVLYLCAPQSPHQEVRPRHDLPRRPRTRRARRARPALPRRHATPRSIPKRAKTSTACASSSGSSLSPAASAATARPKRPAPSTKAASSATCSRTLAAQPSTIPN